MKEDYKRSDITTPVLYIRNREEGGGKVDYAMKM
jgi:hypothetical protein